MKIMLANFTKMVEDSGGMAQVTCNFANELHRRGHEVTLVYSDEKSGAFFYTLDEQVATYDLRNPHGKRIGFPVYLKAKRELLRTFSALKARTVNNEFAEKYLLPQLATLLTTLQPDIIVAFQPAASKALLCDLKTKIPVITMSHGDPEDYFHIYPKQEIPALEKSAVCQVLLPSFAQHIKNHLPKVRTVIIGNAVPQFSERADLTRIKTFYKIIFVGRLAQSHKRPHLLIEAFAKLAPKFPQWQVELWGAKDGELYYKSLTESIRKAHLEEQVLFKGATNNVPAALRQADIFAFPSAYEGFGLSLAEGMSMGLPAVGYRNCSAVNELIVDGNNGLLCADGAEDFATKLALLMTQRELRSHMGEQAHLAMQCYAPEKIWTQWEELIQKIVSEKGGAQA